MVTPRPPGRIADTLTTFEAALMLDTVQESLEAITANSLLNHVTFSMLDTTAQDRGFPYAWSTYPGGWITRYLRQSYITHDPVVRIGVAAANPFYWSELHQDPCGRRVLEDAVRYGVGPCGYTIPHEKDGERSFLSITSRTMIEEDWRYFVEAIYPELLVFTKSLHAKAGQELTLSTVAQMAHDSEPQLYSHHDAPAV